MRSHRSSDHDQLPAPPARRKVIGVANFKLLTLVRYFGLAIYRGLFAFSEDWDARPITAALMAMLAAAMPG